MPVSQHAKPKSDIEIAREAKIKPIKKIAAKLGIKEDSLLPYGNDKAKISLPFIRTLKDKPNGKLILVAGITPTKAGEGKTTTSVGLSDALSKLGKKTAVCLREPSLGPCFGMKGGAAGGGYAQVVPMEDINLHFTGDFSTPPAHQIFGCFQRAEPNYQTLSPWRQCFLASSVAHHNHHAF